MSVTLVTHDDPPAASALERRVAQLEAGQVALARQVAALLEARPRARLSRDDVAMLRRLLPAVVGAFGSEEFFAADLVDGTNHGVRLVCGGRSVRSLGKLLRRSVGVPVDDYLVERLGLERGVGVVRWRILRTS
jgi:hypothetical protein